MCEPYSSVKSITLSVVKAVWFYILKVEYIHPFLLTWNTHTHKIADKKWHFIHWLPNKSYTQNVNKLALSI